MRSYSSIIDISVRLRERAWTDQLRIGFGIFSKTQKVVNVGNFTEVGTDWIQEKKLVVQVSFDQICSWLVFTIQNIKILQSSKIMETVLNYVSINHLFVGLFHLHYLFFHLRFENLVEISVGTLLLFFSEGISLLKTFVHEHLECGELNDGSIGILFSEIGVVNWITSQCACEPRRICTVLLNSIDKRNKVSCRLRHFLSFN